MSPRPRRSSGAQKRPQRSLVFLAPVDQVRAVPAHIPPHHLYRHLGIEPTTFVDQFCNLIRVAEEIAVAEQVELPAPGRATNRAPEDSGGVPAKLPTERSDITPIPTAAR